MKTGTVGIPAFTLKPRTKQFLSTIPTYLTSICSGVTFGITSVMLPQLREDKTIQYNPSDESWIASISSLSMVLGSLISGQIQDRYGRKPAHVLLGIPLIIGWTAIACAPSTSFIILGRFFTGLSIGVYRTVMFVYIGEMASPTFRTFAMVVPTALLTIGILLSHVFGYYLGWKISCYVCIFLSVLICITSLFLKESPLWLISKGRTDEGVELFRWFRGTDDASEAELKTALERQAERPTKAAKETIRVLCSSSFIKPMLTLLVVIVNVQFSGVSVVSFYSQDIFQLTFSGTVDPFIMIVVIDCVVAAVCTIICIFGKSVPKKKTYLISNFGNTVSVAGLVACLIVGYDFKWMPITCLILFFSFSSGIITVGNTFAPELLPSSVRGLGSGIYAALSAIFKFGILKVTPEFMKAYGPAAVFASYGVTSFICGVIMFFKLPDTDGRTLQSIEDSYNKDKVESTPL